MSSALMLHVQAATESKSTECSRKSVLGVSFCSTSDRGTRTCVDALLSALTRRSCLLARRLLRCMSMMDMRRGECRVSASPVGTDGERTLWRRVYDESLRHTQFNPLGSRMLDNGHLETGPQLK
jgi:hypothetical protein